MSSTAVGGGSKRRIGGHFGAAVGASTKRQRGGWRDEVEEEEPPVQDVTGNDDSDSEVMLDPGTPLPSEDEEEPALAAGKSSSGDPPVEESAVGGAEGKLQPPSVVEKVQEPSDAAKSLTEAGEGEKAEREGGTADEAASKVFVLELIVGKRCCGKLRVLLLEGLDEAVEQRLAACVGSDEASGEVDFLVLDGICGFAGHPVLGNDRAKKTATKDAASNLPAEPFAGVEDLHEQSRPEASSAPAAQNGHSSVAVPHSCAGLLTAPQDGPGLALTLAPQTTLDASYRVLGIVLAGRRAFRFLQAVAPLSGKEAKPRVPVFLRHPKVEQDDVCRPHPFLSLEARTASGSREAFSEDPESADAKLPAEEILELADVELEGRDVEVADLKHATFSRERQAGVVKIEESLVATLQRLGTLEGLGETLSGQKVWIEEGSQRLLRVLKKLH
eukprot:TRINITY_DN74745_c0_g1_i1.p1 TRINITY_DN74745_c0_g1~~TRINITY_DN74745_c0_g1_i1.p1  ORF type:complete len:444 (-),score=114.79 TRINITY_DN74745_c0_g1_i1:28-1359(-)